jgi:hypothetical protein
MFKVAVSGILFMASSTYISFYPWNRKTNDAQFRRRGFGGGKVVRGCFHRDFYVTPSFLHYVDHPGICSASTAVRPNSTVPRGIPSQDAKRSDDAFGTSMSRLNRRATLM